MAAMATSSLSFSRGVRFMRMVPASTPACRPAWRHHGRAAQLVHSRGRRGGRPSAARAQREMAPPTARAHRRGPAQPAHQQQARARQRRRARRRPRGSARSGSCSAASGAASSSVAERLGAGEAEAARRAARPGPPAERQRIGPDQRAAAPAAASASSTAPRRSARRARRGRRPASPPPAAARPAPARRRSGASSRAPSNRIVSCGIHSSAAPAPSVRRVVDRASRGRGCDRPSRPPAVLSVARAPASSR